MLTLYGCTRSRATRPIWLLFEMGLDFAQVPVIQARRSAAAGAPMTTASPAFLAINPQGEIPVLDDGGLVLTESLAICLHLAARGGSEVCPRSPAEQALATQWALFAATSVEPPATEVLFTYMEGRQAAPEGLARIEAAAARLTRALTRIEAQVGADGWLMGDRFTVADLMVAECLRYALMHPPLAAAWPVADAWLKRCQARPAFQAMWAQRLAEPE